MITLTWIASSLFTITGSAVTSLTYAIPNELNPLIVSTVLQFPVIACENNIDVAVGGYVYTNVLVFQQGARASFMQVGSNNRINGGSFTYLCSTNGYGY